jgi:hypothetical protein
MFNHLFIFFQHLLMHGKLGLSQLDLLSHLPTAQLLQLLAKLPTRIFILVDKVMNPQCRYFKFRCDIRGNPEALTHPDLKL